MCAEDAPIFLQVRYNIDYNSKSIWFYEKPLGKNGNAKMESSHFNFPRCYIVELCLHLYALILVNILR